ncbi:MAG: Tim44 domain-containing protein [Betaproteobacteria bacterium]|nr:Tim44 domain-containing protein [Betaproteobacteria bacterium]
MRRIVLGFAVALFGATLVLTDADAARLGGARSFGAQRSLTNTPPARPAQRTPQAAPAQQQGAAAPGAAQPQPASGFARWMPMLGGLALGGVLGWLLGANGLGGLLVGMLLLALLVFAARSVIRALAQRRAEPAPPMQYAGLGSETVAAPPPSQAAGFERQAAAPSAAAHVPAGFDVAGFLRGAKLNYMKLQIANDRGDLEELREFTSPELFEELKKDVLGRGGAAQRTDVLSLNADLLEVATEGDRHWASVRFSGTIRESAAGATEGFEEVWNLAKPVDGSSGWTLAGIQQMH